MDIDMAQDGEAQIQEANVEMNDEEQNPKMEEDMIAQNFKGRTRQIISYKAKDGTDKKTENVIEFFAAILIGVIGFKEIYEAWEQSYKDQIEYHESEENNYASSPSLGKSTSSINPKALVAAAEQSNNAEKTDWLE